MNEYFLPKKYLSYSAISTWLSSKDRFRKQYYEGKPFQMTPELTFGKKIADLLEHGDESVQHILQYPQPEQEITTTIEGVPVFGFIDSFDPERCAFLEYKTGKEPWTQNRVQKHLQLDIYSLCIQNIFGKVDDTCHLIWMQTERVDIPQQGRITHENAYGIRMTGRVETFERTITQEERDNTRGLIVRVATEISEDFAAWKDERENRRTAASRGGRQPLLRR
jgi:hypothetical protein